MRDFTNYILKEPFFHFIALGILIFIYFYINQNQNTTTKQIINLSKYEIMQLKIEYKEQFQRDINSIELQSFIETKIFQKILLKEAQSLKLDTKDKLITQRLVDKMKFIMVSEGSTTEPTEDELFIYYKNNIDEYSKIKNLSFVHIFLDTRDITKANSLLNIIKIADIKAKDAKSFSNPFSGYDKFQDINKTKLKKEYGNYFTNKVFHLKSDIWSTPIPSKYGYHLINITAKNISEPIDFNEVLDRVYKDFLSHRKEESIKKSYEKFALQYEIKKN